jgi:hypothetical protein
VPKVRLANGFIEGLVREVIDALATMVGPGGGMLPIQQMRQETLVNGTALAVADPREILPSKEDPGVQQDVAEPLRFALRVAESCEWKLRHGGLPHSSKMDDE